MRKAFNAVTGGAQLSESTDQPVLALIDESLAIACASDRVEIVRYLIAFGADPTAPLGHDSLPGVLHAASVGSALIRYCTQTLIYTYACLRAHAHTHTHTHTHFCAHTNARTQFTHAQIDHRLSSNQGAALSVLKYLESELMLNVAEPTGRDGSTALHLAAECNGGASHSTYAQTCEWLAKRIDVNLARAKDRMTPLHVAARFGRDKVNLPHHSTARVLHCLLACLCGCSFHKNNRARQNARWHTHAPPVKHTTHLLLLLTCR